jgi:ArsR family transcriptional regulator
MKINDASQLFAALGHESRLAIFRALVETGPEGLNASAIGIKLDIPPATLSFHLAHLVREKLIKSKKASRFIYYSANYGVMDNLIAFLTKNCCAGKPCLPKSAARMPPLAKSRKSALAQKGRS